ncbi:unnamed protein product [Mortierella alpina]
MGMPITFDVSEDEVRTKLCTAPDCRCPDCHQRRLIRLGSLTAHRHRYSRSGQMGGVHAGYMFTNLPDYRFRHALNAETHVPAAAAAAAAAAATAATLQAVTRRSGSPLDHHRDRRGDSNRNSNSTGPETRSTTTGALHEGTTLTSAARGRRTDVSSIAAGSSQTSVRNGTAVERNGPAVSDSEQQQQQQQQEQQERCDEEEGAAAYGRDRHQRVRAQAWATNVEGLDYYHESDQDS